MTNAVCCVACGDMTHRPLQLVDSIDKGLVQHEHAMCLGHPDHVHCAAIPPRPLKLQIPSTGLHQALGSLYTQPGCSVPEGSPKVQ